MAPIPHPLRLLASAIVGRPIYIAYLQDSHARAYTDGEHLFVDINDPLEQQRYAILVQSLLLAGGSLNRNALALLVGQPRQRQRYLCLEVERCAGVMQERLPARFLAAVAATPSGHCPQSPQESLVLAQSARVLPEPPVWYGTIHPLKLLRRQTRAAGKPLRHSELSELEAHILAQQQQAGQEQEDERKVKDNLWQWLSSPLGKNGMFSKFLRDLLDMTSAPDDGAADGAAGMSPDKATSRRVSRLSDAANALRSTARVMIDATLRLDESGTHSYPEWDAGKQRYRPHWVRVEEVEAYSDEPLLADVVWGSGDNRRYQRALAGLCFNYEPHRGQQQGDDIVLDRLVDLAVSVQTGVSGNERIYRANLKTRRDLGVQILLDASSSTLELAAAGNRICDLQAEAAWQLCQAFTRMGDRVAMHGFHSWGRTLLRLQRLKSFDEQSSAAVERRIKRLSVAGYTRLGAAIRHATEQLQRNSGMPCRLLLVIADGYPFDDQYEDHYAAEDTRKALQEARRAGVACVCLSVGSDADQQRLKKIYGEANYLAVDKVEKIALKLRPVIEAALTASLRRV